MELLPTEILFGIVKCLHNQQIKQLSLISSRMRDVCLPFLFQKISIVFSNEGLGLLESILGSKLHRHIVSFEYVAPMLLNPAIRNYDVFKTEVITPECYVDICEDYDDVNGREDWNEMEYLSGEHPSYTRVYKTIRRTCAEQQGIIEAGRDSTLISLAFGLLHNLKELILVFCETKRQDDWERDYHQVSGMTQPRSYEHHIQLVLAALKGRSMTLEVIQLTCREPPNHPASESSHWNSLANSLAELVGYAPGLRLVESDMALELLCRVSLNIRELSLCSIYMELTSIESFLQLNAKSLRSLSVHDVRVIDQGNHARLTPAHVGNTIGLTIGRERRFSDFPCSCSFQEGWKLFFSSPKAKSGEGEL